MDVHHQQVLVLKEDLQLHGNGPDRRRTLRRGKIHCQPVPLPENCGGERPLAVHRQSGFCPLQAAHQGGGNLQLRFQKTFDGPPTLCPGYDQFQRCHGPPPLPK